MAVPRVDRTKQNDRERERRQSDAAYAERRRAATRRWKLKPENAAKIRDWYYRRKYGLTTVEVADLLDEQGGTCAICATKVPGNRTLSKHAIGRWHVDHDHKTGIVRGVLCGDCNIGLGAFRDDVDALLNAAVYLENSRDRK